MFKKRALRNKQKATNLPDINVTESLSSSSSALQSPLTSRPAHDSKLPISPLASPLTPRSASTIRDDGETTPRSQATIPTGDFSAQAASPISLLPPTLPPIARVASQYGAGVFASLSFDFDEGRVESNSRNDTNNDQKGDAIAAESSRQENHLPAILEDARSSSSRLEKSTGPNQYALRKPVHEVARSHTDRSPESHITYPAAASELRPKFSLPSAQESKSKSLPALEVISPNGPKDLRDSSSIISKRSKKSSLKTRSSFEHQIESILLSQPPTPTVLRTSDLQRPSTAGAEGTGSSRRQDFSLFSRFKPHTARKNPDEPSDVAAAAEDELDRPPSVLRHNLTMHGNFSSPDLLLSQRERDRLPARPSTKLANVHSATPREDTLVIMDSATSHVPSVTIGTPYQEMASSFPLPQFVMTRPQDEGQVASMAGVPVPSHHTSAKKTDSPKAVPAKKKSRLLNPIALLQRRRVGQDVEIAEGERSAQDQALAQQKSVAAVGIEKVPADFDPRIKGKLVHDFSVPRGKRNTFDEIDVAEVQSAELSSQSSVPAHIQLNSGPPVPAALSNPRRSVHTPVFVEHLGEDPRQSFRASSIHAESLENKDFLQRASKQSSVTNFSQESAAAFPPFARRSQNLESVYHSLDDVSKRSSDSQSNQLRDSSGSSSTNPSPAGGREDDYGLEVKSDAERDPVSVGAGFARTAPNNQPPGHISSSSDTSLRRGDHFAAAFVRSTDSPVQGYGTHPDPLASTPPDAAQGSGGLRWSEMSFSESSVYSSATSAYTVTQTPTDRSSLSRPVDTPLSAHSSKSTSVDTALPQRPTRDTFSTRSDKRGSKLTRSQRSPRSPKYSNSVASKFSFQLGSGAAEEQALEENYRKAATKENDDPPSRGSTKVETVDFDDDDYFDEDAMDDMDEMEVQEQQLLDQKEPLHQQSFLAPPTANAGSTHSNSYGSSLGVSPWRPNHQQFPSTSDFGFSDDGDVPYPDHPDIRTHSAYLTGSRPNSTLTSGTAWRNSMVVDHYFRDSYVTPAHSRMPSNVSFMRPSSRTSAAAVLQSPSRDSTRTGNRLHAGSSFPQLQASPTRSVQLEALPKVPQADDKSRQFFDSKHVDVAALDASRSHIKESDRVAHQSRFDAKVQEKAMVSAPVLQPRPGKSDDTGVDRASKTPSMPESQPPSGTTINGSRTSDGVLPPSTKSQGAFGDASTTADNYSSQQDIPHRPVSSQNSQPARTMSVSEVCVNDDMYFDDGNFDDELDEMQGDSIDEDVFDDDSYLRGKPISISPVHKRDISIGSISSRNLSDFRLSNSSNGPYPSFAMPNGARTHQRESQLMLEDLPLQVPIDPRYVPQRNPSEDAKRLGLSKKAPPLPGPISSDDASQSRMQHQLDTYHAALADAANKAAAEGRFAWSPNMPEQEDDSVPTALEDRDAELVSHSHEELGGEIPMPYSEALSNAVSFGHNDPTPAIKDTTMSRPASQQPYIFPATGMDFDFGFNHSRSSSQVEDNQMFSFDASDNIAGNTYDDAYEDEDDLLVAAANAEVLANDDEGFYGQEFQFYGRPRSSSASASAAGAASELLPIHGGYFGADGDDGLTRNKSIKEPNLTPITERSEFSTRNSFINLGASLWGPLGPPSAVSFGAQSPALLTRIPQPAHPAHPSASPATGLLAGGDAELTAADLGASFEQLRKLRANAFGGSNPSLQSGSNRSSTHSLNHSGLLGVGQGYFGPTTSSSFTGSWDENSFPSNATASHVLSPSAPMLSLSDYENEHDYPYEPVLDDVDVTPKRPANVSHFDSTLPYEGNADSNDLEKTPTTTRKSLNASYHTQSLHSPQALWQHQQSRPRLSLGVPLTSPSFPSHGTLQQHRPNSAIESPGSSTSASHPQQQQSQTWRPSHSRKTSGADSVTYVQEPDPQGSGKPRWVIERRRTSEAGELELVGREIVVDGHI